MPSGAIRHGAVHVSSTGQLVESDSLKVASSPSCLLLIFIHLKLLKIGNWLITVMKHLKKGAVAFRPKLAVDGVLLHNKKVNTE